MSTQFHMSSLNRSNFAKIPTNLSPTFQNFYLIVMPVLSLICQQFEAQTGFPLSKSLTLPIPDNRLTNPEPVQPLDITNPAYQDLGAATQRALKENEPFLLARYNFLKQQYLAQLLGQSILKEQLTIFIPNGHPFQIAISGTAENWINQDFGTQLEGTKNYFLTSIHIDTERAKITSFFLSTTLTIKNAEDLQLFIKQLTNNRQIFDLLLPTEPMSDRSFTNYLLSSIQRSTHYTQCPILAIQLHQYESTHQNTTDPPRASAEVIAIIERLLPSILHTAQQIKTVYSVSETSTENAIDTETSPHQTALAAVASTKKPTASVNDKLKLNTKSSKSSELKTVLAFMADDSNVSKLQSILAAAKSTSPRSAKSSTTTTAHTNSKQSSTSAPYVIKRYCYSCGSTSGTNLHISRTCPSPNDHHEPTCNWTNRAEFPRSAAP